MNNSSRSVFDRFAVNLDLALFFLVLTGMVELVLYRLLTQMGFYVGVGTEGTRALIADISIFAMVLSGALSGILLFWAIARVVNHPRIGGVWWRGVLIFISPLYLLSIFWSIWTTLSNWVLAASLVGVQITVLLVCIISILRPVSHGMKRLFGVVGLALLTGATKWFVLDFIQMGRVEKWGLFLLNAYEVAQFFMVALPFFAFYLFVADSKEKWMGALRRPHLPALILSTLLVVVGAVVIQFIQRVTGEGDAYHAGTYVMRVAYHTIGLKLAWPLASVMFTLSLFFLGMTCFSLIMKRGEPHSRSPKNRRNREIGFGLALIYIAGIQPVSVYQLAMSLLGVLLLTVGVADAYPKSEPSQDMLHLMKELDPQTPPTR